MTSSQILSVSVLYVIPSSKISSQQGFLHAIVIGMFYIDGCSFVKIKKRRGGGGREGGREEGEEGEI